MPRCESIFALTVSTLLAPIISPVQAATPFVPGSSSKVTISLAITSESPQAFKRDETGKFVTDSAGKKIPAYVNYWEIYNSENQTLGRYGEEITKLVKRRYSNREFLTDLVSLGVIAGPIRGWSVQRVEAHHIDIYSDDPDGGWDYGQPVVRFYAVKSGQTPVLIPEEVFGMDSPYTSQKLFGWRGDGSFGIVNGIKESWSAVWGNVADPDPDNWEDWDLIRGKSSTKSISKCITTIESELAAPQVVMPVNPPWEWFVHDDYEEVRFHKNLQLSGLEMPKEGKTKGVMVGDTDVFSFSMQGSSKISGIQGTGPSLRGWSDSGFVWLSQSLVEGAISFAAGKYGDFTSYPGILIED